MLGRQVSPPSQPTPGRPPLPPIEAGTAPALEPGTASSTEAQLAPAPQRTPVGGGIEAIVPGPYDAPASSKAAAAFATGSSPLLATTGSRPASSAPMIFALVVVAVLGLGVVALFLLRPKDPPSQPSVAAGAAGASATKPTAGPAAAPAASAAALDDRARPR